MLTADNVEEYFLAKTVEQYARGVNLERMPEIPLDEIDYHCDSESRAKDIDGLMEHIRKNGLVEPIVVCKSDDEKYAILAGHRRYCAYVVLNKNHPGEGWDKIPAKIIDRKELDDYLKRRKADFDGPTTSIDIDEIGLPSQNSDGVDREKGIEDLAESIKTPTTVIV